MSLRLKRRVLGYSLKVYPKRLVQPKKRFLWIHSEHPASVFSRGNVKRSQTQVQTVSGVSNGFDTWGGQ